MSKEDKYSLPKTIISELKDPVKLKGIWSIVKAFPAILFLVALYLIADRYIDTKEKTELEKIKKEFLYRSIDDLASPDAVKRRTATLLVGMIMNDSEDPDDFLKMMYVTESDSANKEAYIHEAVNQLLPRLFDEDEQTRTQSFDKLRSYWMHQKVLIPELLNNAIKHSEEEQGEAGIELTVKIIDDYSLEVLKIYKPELVRFFDEIRDITTETYRIRNDMFDKLKE